MEEPLIIIEEEHYVAIAKPPGLIVHGDGRTIESSLAEWVGERFPNLRGVGGDWVSPQGEHIALNGIVHRLDRTTSGVVLIAKTDEMFSRFKRAFKARAIHKSYLAYLYGHVETKTGEVVAEIVRSKDLPRRWCARPTTHDDSRTAITKWSCDALLIDGETKEPVTRVVLEPLTGRTHQIRVHSASIGHPVVGDHMYAREKQRLLGFTRPALHASSISFVIKGVSTHIIAPLPGDFQRAGMRAQPFGNK